MKLGVDLLLDTIQRLSTVGVLRNPDDPYSEQGLKGLTIPRQVLMRADRVID